MIVQLASPEMKKLHMEWKSHHGWKPNVLPEGLFQIVWSWPRWYLSSWWAWLVLIFLFGQTSKSWSVPFFCFLQFSSKHRVDSCEAMATNCYYNYHSTPVGSVDCMPCSMAPAPLQLWCDRQMRPGKEFAGCCTIRRWQHAAIWDLLQNIHRCCWNLHVLHFFWMLVCDQLDHPCWNGTSTICWRSCYASLNPGVYETWRNLGLVFSPGTDDVRQSKTLKPFVWKNDDQIGAVVSRNGKPLKTC